MFCIKPWKVLPALVSNTFVVVNLVERYQAAVTTNVSTKSQSNLLAWFQNSALPPAFDFSHNL